MRSVLICFFFIPLAVFSAAAQESKQECPKIEVVGPAGVTQKGEEMTFTANGLWADPEIRYDWTVSVGTIVKGQGTASIVVVSKEPGVTVKATVEVSGLGDGCENTGSESAPVAEVPPSCSLDEWGRLRPNDLRGRLDMFFADLFNNPTNKGIFIFNGVPLAKRTINHPKITFIVAHARFRKFDIERLIFAFDKQEPSQWEDEYFGRTVLFRIPPNADLPGENGALFYGSLLKGKDPTQRAPKR